ncbi:RNA-binding protein 25-like isoform X2 [Corticium candelabrum]|uniref:RNA-binding protein 25-like isoform X2 n=1 Tax=Corticium candelabrum TaxID=121492 RepID=UPI002E270FE3|nr:RNA-binding protein 25-like isoform X2 [Corticium candelabrum]
MAFPPPPMGGLPMMPLRMPGNMPMRVPPPGMMPGMPPPSLPSGVPPNFVPGHMAGVMSMPQMAPPPIPAMTAVTMATGFPPIQQASVPQPLLPGLPLPPPPPSVVAEATLSAPPKPATVTLPDAPVTTAFVGNISEKVPDNVIRQLLMSCGTVLSWKRVQGATGKLQAFGFCEYKEPEATLRSLRQLHNLRLAEKTVTVKVDAKTRKQLDEYLIAKKAALSGQRLPEKTEATQNGEEDPKSTEELDDVTKAEDEQVRNHILLLLKQNQATWHGNDEELNRSVAESMLTVAKQKGLVEKDGGLEDLNMDESERQLVTDEIRKFRGSYARHPDEPPKRSKEERERTRQLLEREKTKSSEEDQPKQQPSVSEERQSTRTLVEDTAEEYQRLRKERNQRRREEAYDTRFKDWEIREKRRTREYEKEDEKEKEKAERRARDRKKAKRHMEKYDDEKDDKRYYSSSDMFRLRRERQMEIEDDLWDKRKQEEEMEIARRKAEEEEAKANEPRQPLIQPLKLQTAKAKAEQLQPQAVAVKPAPAVPFPPIKVEAAPPVEKEPGVTSPVVDTTPAVLRKSPPTLVGPEYVAAQIKRQRELEEQAKQLAEADAKKKKFTVQQAFSSEQEAEQIIMDKLKRKLVPLEYTEEEQQSVGRSNIPQADKKKKSIKSLIEHIPTTRDELFGYKIEWSVVDESLVKNRIKPWVNKKIVEYIGEEEPTLVEFICDKVGKHTPAESVLSDVTMVLDEEAELFVNKLWRLLIFETESKLLGLIKKEGSS